MLMDASVVVIPLLKQKTDILHPDNISHLNCFASIWCSIENIFLASTAEGYGCTLRIPLGNEAEYAKNVLDFPNDYFMPCFIGIGKPKKDAPVIKQKVIDTDAAKLLEIYATYVKKTAVSFEYKVPSIEEFAERIRKTSAKYLYIKAVGNKGEILGYAYAGAFKIRSAYNCSWKQQYMSEVIIASQV